MPFVLLWGSLSGRVASTHAIVYDVRAFGAKDDGKNLDSPSINKAIEAAAAAGGGAVWTQSLAEQLDLGHWPGECQHCWTRVD